MNKGLKKLISIFIISSLVINSFIFPPEAYAFNLFREIGNLVKNTSRFVVRLPDKATRWMGPVLGPIASAILTKNLLKNPNLAKIFRHARRADSTIQKIENIKKQVKDTKKLYHDEAQRMRDKADELVKIRKGLAEDLLKHGNWEEYKDQVAAIHELIEIHEEAASRFESAANNINEQNIVKMLGSEVLSTVMGNIRDVVILEVSKDLEKTIDPDIISKFLSGNGGFDDVIDFFVDREISDLLGEEKPEGVNMDDLRDRIRDQIKASIKRDRDFFKDNWHNKIAEIIQAQIDKLNENTADLESKTDKTVSDVTKNPPKSQITKEQQEIIDYFEGTIPDTAPNDDTKKKPDGTYCGPGYIFKRMSGTGCVQENCNSVPDAHWSYDGYCVCGSSGSINEDPTDPNIECAFPPSYEPCPSCVYACIHSDQKCKLDGVGF